MSVICLSAFLTLVLDSLNCLYITFAQTETENMAEILQKVIEENRQGEAYAPFAEDPNAYSKKFYIESYGCCLRAKALVSIKK